jgi:TPR repeat protein
MVQTERQPAASPPKSTTPQPDASSAQPAPSQAPPAAAEKQSSSAAKATAENGDEAADTSDDNEAEAGNEESAAAPAPTRKTRTAPADKAPAVSTPPASAEDRLVADGRKYLYGDGVPENCDRARRNLTSAAGNNDPQAQSILGTMYATGHCVTRDLPTAYRWFARALHTEPGNDRVKQDLEVLWRQMSADERQIAMRSQ